MRRYYLSKMQEEQNNKKGPWRRFFKIVGINLGVMILVIIALLWCVSLWLDGYTHHDERIEVPDLSGIEAEEASYYLERLGLQSEVIDSVYSDARPGSVIEQIPVAGLPVKKGRLIYLTINAKAQRMVKMVDVREWSSRQAQTRLRELGFVVDSIKHVASEFDDLVLSVTIKGSDVVPGKEYPYRTKVVMHVGSSKIELDPADVTATNDSTVGDWL